MFTNQCANLDQFSLKVVGGFIVKRPEMYSLRVLQGVFVGSVGRLLYAVQHLLIRLSSPDQLAEPDNMALGHGDVTGNIICSHCTVLY